MESLLNGLEDLKDREIIHRLMLHRCWDNVQVLNWFMCHAIEYGRLELFGNLVACANSHGNEMKAYEFWNVFWAIIRKGLPDTLKLFINNIEFVTANARYVAVMAANEGNLFILKWLVSEYKLKAYDTGWIEHSFIDSATNGHFNVLQWLTIELKLTNLNLSVETIKTALKRATEQQHTQIAEWLRKNF